MSSRILFCGVATIIRLATGQAEGNIPLPLRSSPLFHSHPSSSISSFLFCCSIPSPPLLIPFCSVHSLLVSLLLHHLLLLLYLLTFINHPHRQHCSGKKIQSIIFNYLFVKKWKKEWIYDGWKCLVMCWLNTFQSDFLDFPYLKNVPFIPPPRHHVKIWASNNCGISPFAEHDHLFNEVHPHLHPHRERHWGQHCQH